MTSSADSRLLYEAIAALRRRAARPGGYAGLSEAGIGGLCATLSGIAGDGPELDGVDRPDAISLAHRVLDDDHPEHSDMWPAGG